MAGPILKTCCCCQSLRNGSIICGVVGIILSIATLIIMYTVEAQFQTILFDWLPQWAVKLILAINLIMTILISILLIVGVVRRNHFMMLPWIVLGITLAVGLLISVVYTAVVFFIDSLVLAGVLWLVFGLIAVVVYVYMWIVVYSYFALINEENERGRYNKQPYRR